MYLVYGFLYYEHICIAFLYFCICSDKLKGNLMISIWFALYKYSIDLVRVPAGKIIIEMKMV